MKEARKDRFVVIHPLDDLPEEKVNTDALCAMPMKLSVRLSLLSLRGYLILMFLLVVYHVVGLTGAFGHSHFH